MLTLLPTEGPLDIHDGYYSYLYSLEICEECPPHSLRLPSGERRRLKKKICEECRYTRTRCSLVNLTYDDIAICISDMGKRSI